MNKVISVTEKNNGLMFQHIHDW